MAPELWVSAAVGSALALGLALERVAPHESVRPAWGVNLGIWLAATALRAAVFGGAEWQLARWSEGGHFGLLQAAAAPGWLAIGVTVLGLDLVSYLWHRANHAVPFLWRFHRVHHADPALHVSTALRFHPGEILMSVPVRLAAVAALGAPVAGVVVFECVFGAMNALEHARFALPAPLERALQLWLVTPALHRVHHSVVRREHDSNYATTFTLWDRAGRSFRANDPASHFPIGLGPGETGDPRALGAMLLEPFRARGPVT
ncbi:MAG TPA: sterol desaturase family protein [Myxococcota bacterium]|nr:sterol desaturase family protein [Myxococcota bacterium]